MARTMDRMTAMEAFVAVAEAGSFTRAAARLGISVPMTTLHVARLEEHLKVRLFNRTTRRVDLTDEGHRLLEPARDLLGRFSAAERAVRPGGGLSGVVRVDAPASIGHATILPRLPELHALHPEIVVELTLGDRGTTFRLDGFDIVMRVGEPPLSGWITHPLGETRQLCMAAPAYLAVHGVPAEPEDVAAHQCLLYASVEVPGGRPFLFERDGRHVRLRPRPAFTFNDGAAILAAARSGLGIAQQLERVARDDLRTGRLVPLLEEWVSPVGVSLMAARDRHALPHVRAVMEFLAVPLD